MIEPYYPASPVDVLLDRIAEHLPAYSAQVQAAFDVVRQSRESATQLNPGLNGHSEKLTTAASDSAQQSDGQVTASGAGSAQDGDTLAARSPGTPPSPETPSRATASADEVLARIASLMTAANLATGQTREVATKFLCRARSLVNEGKIGLAARDINSAVTVMRGAQ